MEEQVPKNAAGEGADRPPEAPSRATTAMPAAQTVTRFELFFDLVYVFAFTQVTVYMAHAHSGMGVLQGMLVLTLLWVSWSAYAWLGNQARSDRSVVRAGMSVGMAGIFVVALALPEAWRDAPGGLDAPLVLAIAYLFVRCAHLVTYELLARGDQDLAQQITATAPLVLAGGGLLIAGALIGGGWQTLLWAAAIAVDWGGIYIVSRWGRGSWRIHSAEYFAERHGLVLILAIGESLVALGTGAAGQEFDTPLLIAAVLGVATALGLWWLYFDVVTWAVEHRLYRARGRTRVQLTTDAYGYGHLPIVAGIVLAALGIEGVVAHAASGDGLGVFSAAALYGGTALYLAGLLLFGRIMVDVWGPFRLAAMGLLLAMIPVAAVLPPLAALAGVAAVLAAVAALETWWYADLRHSVRG